LAIGAFGYFESYRAYIDFYSTKVQHIVRALSVVVDGDAVKRYIETNETDGYYESLRESFGEIKSSMDIQYLYVFTPYDDHLMYILEAQTERDDPDAIASFGDRFDYTQSEYEHLVPDIKAGAASSEMIIARNSQLSNVPAVEAWAPVFTSDGELVAMVEGDLSLEVVYANLSRYAVIMIALSSAVILAAVAVLIARVHAMITRPLLRITDSARNLVAPEGDGVSYVSEVHTGDEFQVLSEALESMSRDIEGYAARVGAVAAAEERIATERGVVSEIQATLLPHPIDSRLDFAVAGAVENGRDMGGAFYDFFFIDDSRLGVVIADVSGSGMSSALYMTVAKTMIKDQMMSGADIATAMSRWNTMLYDSSPGGMTLSAFAGILDIPEGSLTYVNAAFPAPLMAHRGERFTDIADRHAVPIGESRNVSFRSGEAKLRQGDVVVCNSPSLLKPAGPGGDAYGVERLRIFLHTGANRALPPEELSRKLLGEVVGYAGGSENVDCFAVLALEYRKSDRALAEITVSPSADGFAPVRSFLKTQMTEENGIGGAKYAVAAVAAEELFVLAAGRSPEDADITVRCGVVGGRVEIGVSYEGELADPLSNPTRSQRDALSFIEKHVTKLAYSDDGSRNILTMIFN
jgi:sigma-B regulation protein RsbU (phosphoserine phosphatase)